MRCTCDQEPDDSSGRGARLTVIRGREVVPHAPMVAAGLVEASKVPVLVSIVIGTSIAMVFTLYPETKSGAIFLLSSASAAGLSTPPPAPARKFSESKAAP